MVPEADRFYANQHNKVRISSTSCVDTLLQLLGGFRIRTQRALPFSCSIDNKYTKTMTQVEQRPLTRRPARPP
jgi:hypothetical protein